MAADLRTPAHAQQSRRIIHKTKGRCDTLGGLVTRLVSPGDIGRLINPFVLLDHALIQPAGTSPLMLHPHSGISTFTTVIEGALHIDDSAGLPRTLSAGGAEWMQAGGGVWHGGPFSCTGVVRLFQLWIALPPRLELAPPHELFLEPEDIPATGPARVLLGGLDGVRSREGSELPLNYLHVRLAGGERWRYEPPEGHDVLWIAVYSGSVDAGERVSAGELAIFESSGRGVGFDAGEACGFMLGSAKQSPFDLVEGYYSVHTNAQALQRGEAAIQQLGAELCGQGRLSEAHLAKVTRQMTEARNPTE
jgi:redox-sensitive bicupin YhaK (pirin superfamily)